REARLAWIDEHQVVVELEPGYINDLEIAASELLFHRKLDDRGDSHSLADEPFDRLDVRLDEHSEMDVGLLSQELLEQGNTLHSPRLIDERLAGNIGQSGIGHLGKLVLRGSNEDHRLPAERFHDQ